MKDDIIEQMTDKVAVAIPIDVHRNVVKPMVGVIIVNLEHKTERLVKKS
jgi:hypothetical protein